MEYLMAVILIIGFSAVVYSNYKIFQEVNDFHTSVKTKLDDIVNDINDVNNNLMDVISNKNSK